MGVLDCGIGKGNRFCLQSISVVQFEKSGANLPGLLIVSNYHKRIT